MIDAARPPVLHSPHTKSVWMAADGIRQRARGHDSPRGALVQARTTGDGVRGSGIRNASCCPEQFALIAAEVQRVTRHPSIVAWCLDRGDALTPTHAALRFKR